MRDILAWILAVELLGLAVLPLLRAFFDNRRDAALLSRPLGLAIVAYLAWALTLVGFPFERGVLVLALLLVAIAAFLVHRRTREGFPPPFFSSEEKRAALLFWASTSIFLIVRAVYPEIFGQEKFMDLAFLNSLTRNINMPPIDPWMSGHRINYYYWGYLLAAAATKLSHVSTFVSYNLSLATFGGYSFVAAACLGFRLSRGRRAAAIAAGFATVFAGNLVGALDGWNYFLGRGFDYFHASRVIASGDTINEFPFFTFLQADLHPHLLAFPYFVAAFAVGHRFLIREPSAPKESAPGIWGFLGRWSPAFLLTLVGGTAIAANLWALPAIGILLAAVCAFRKTRGRDLPNAKDMLLGLLGGAVLLLIAYELWFAYEASFSLTSRNPEIHGIARTTMTSDLIEFLGVWGIFFAVTLAAVWHKPPSEDEAARRRHQLVVAAVVALCLLAALWTKTPVLAVLLPLILLAAHTGWKAIEETHEANEVFCAFLLLLGLSMIAGCEFVHFKDTYGEKLQRMNTIFKFYNQAWPLIAIPAAVLIEKRWREISAGKPRRALAFLLAICAVAALLYPAAAIVQKVRQHQGPLTLNARTALTARNPGDAAAIAWLERNVGGGVVLLEATGDPYSEYARISTHTGIPTVLGWGNHEGLWRENDPEIGERAGLVRAFYTSGDPAAAYQIAQKYKVGLVVLGELETRAYPNASAISTYPFLQPVFSGPTTVYRVVGRPAGP